MNSIFYTLQNSTLKSSPSNPYIINLTIQKINTKLIVRIAYSHYLLFKLSMNKSIINTLTLSIYSKTLLFSRNQLINSLFSKLNHWSNKLIDWNNQLMINKQLQTNKIINYPNSNYRLTDFLKILRKFSIKITNSQTKLINLIQRVRKTKLKSMTQKTKFSFSQTRSVINNNKYFLKTTNLTYSTNKFRKIRINTIRKSTICSNLCILVREKLLIIPLIILITIVIIKFINKKFKNYKKSIKLQICLKLL